MVAKRLGTGVVLSGETTKSEIDRGGATRVATYVLLPNTGREISISSLVYENNR